VTQTFPGSARRRRRGVAVALLALVVLVGVRVFILVPVGIDGDSMEPTVHGGDIAVISKLADSADSLDRGDLVVFDDPEGDLSLKRVIALPGDELVILDAVLEVNGRPVDEPYVDRASIDGSYFRRVVVPEGSVFLMGDNRARSIDSRYYGAVAEERILGRVLLHW
jgi:signal peptidase I